MKSEYLSQQKKCELLKINFDNSDGFKVNGSK